MTLRQKAPHLAVESASALLAALSTAVLWPSPLALLGAGVVGVCLTFAVVIWQD